MVLTIQVLHVRYAASFGVCVPAFWKESKAFETSGSCHSTTQRRIPKYRILNSQIPNQTFTVSIILNSTRNLVRLYRSYYYINGGLFCVRDEKTGTHKATTLNLGCSTLLNTANVVKEISGGRGWPPPAESSRPTGLS